MEETYEKFYELSLLSVRLLRTLLIGQALNLTDDPITDEEFESYHNSVFEATEAVDKASSLLLLPKTWESVSEATEAVDEESSHLLLPKTWEYATLDLKTRFFDGDESRNLPSWREFLDRLGKDSWELVSVVRLDGNDCVAFFKREAKQSK
jgi:hypothetical protein